MFIGMEQIHDVDGFRKMGLGDSGGLNLPGSVASAMGFGVTAGAVWIGEAVRWAAADPSAVYEVMGKPQ